MGNRYWLTVAAVAVGTLALEWGAQAQLPSPPGVRAIRNASLADMVSVSSKVAAEDVNKVIAALGPAIRDKLAAGQVVELPGLGTFKVVRIPAHADLVDGRPATIPAVNYITFQPVQGVVNAANSPTADPVEVVPPFQFVPLPGQTPSMKAPYTREPNVRIR